MRRNPGPVPPALLFRHPRLARAEDGARADPRDPRFIGQWGHLDYSGIVVCDEHLLVYDRFDGRSARVYPLICTEAPWSPWPDSPPPGTAGLLAPAMPNPFNPTTDIAFLVLEDGRATVRVYDLAGRHITELFAAAVVADEYITSWDGTDTDGRTVPSGVYLVNLDVNGTQADVKKVAVVR